MPLPGSSDDLLIRSPNTGAIQRLPQPPIARRGRRPSPAVYRCRTVGTLQPGAARKSPCGTMFMCRSPSRHRASALLDTTRSATDERPGRAATVAEPPLGYPAPPGDRGDLVAVSDDRHTIYLTPTEYDTATEQELRYLLACKAAGAR